MDKISKYHPKPIWLVVSTCPENYHNFMSHHDPKKHRERKGKIL